MFFRKGIESLLDLNPEARQRQIGVGFGQLLECEFRKGRSRLSSKEARLIGAFRRILEVLKLDLPSSGKFKGLEDWRKPGQQSDYEER